MYNIIITGQVFGTRGYGYTGLHENPAGSDRTGL